MKGVFVNTATVILGSILGLLFKNGIKEKYKDAVMKTIGLCTVAIGISGLMQGGDTLVLILSSVTGVLIGTLFNLDGKINSLGNLGTKRFRKDDNETSLAEGFTGACLLFCVGSMTIVGSLESGINGDDSMIFTKAVLDLFSSMVLASSLGVGVLLSSVFVLVFQGLLVISASYLAPFMTEGVIAQISKSGGLIILALGLNLTGITKIKVANLLPALVFSPCFYYLFTHLIKL